MNNNSKRKRRNLLYQYTFLKWTVERRLSTFEKTAIETTLAIHNFGNNATEQNFNKFCESVADIKTMVEVAEQSFPLLRIRSEDIMKEKLTILDLRTQEKGEEPEEEEAPYPTESIKTKNFFQKLAFWNK
jgi:hypothetical protein